MLAVAPGGKAVASAFRPSGDGKEWEVGLWDPTTGKDRPVPTEFVKRGISALTFGRDGKELFLTGYAGGGQPGVTVEAWDVSRTERRVVTSLIHDYGVSSPAISADGAMAAVGAGKSIRLLDMKAGKEVGTLSERAYARMAAFSPDGATLAVAGFGIGLRLWDTATARRRSGLSEAPASFDWVAFSPDGRKVAGQIHGGDSPLIVYEADTGKTPLTTEGGMLGAFTPDYRRVAIVPWGPNRGLVLRDAETGKELALITKEQAWNDGPVVAAHGHLLAVALHEKPEVLLWDMKEQREVGRLRGLPGPVLGLAFTADGQSLACCSYKFHGVRFWDVKADRERGALEDPEHVPHGFGFLALSPDGRFAAAAHSYWGVVSVWERASGQLLHRWKLPSATAAPVFAPDSRHLAIPNPDGTAYILRLAPPPEAKAAFPPLDPEWVKKVQALKPEEQVKEVAAELKRRNPKFDDSKVGPVKQPDGSYRVGISTDEVTDIFPVRGLSAVKGLYLAGSGAAKGQLVDLEPLRGLPLTHLELHHNPRLSDLTPLAGMPLEELRLLNTDVADLEPLRGLKQLRSLDLASPRETDLTPLESHPVERLTLWGAKFKNITVLERLPLKYLNVAQFQLIPEPTRQALRNKATLETINNKPAAEFWKEYDARQKVAFPPLDPAWVKKVQALKPEEQVKEVEAELKRRNPQFDGETTARLNDKAVVGMTVRADEIQDLTPLLAWPGLEAIAVSPRDPPEKRRSKLRDLSPLSTLKLQRLHVEGTVVSDLTPVRGMPLEKVLVNAVDTVAPLQGMKLQYFAGTIRDGDLKPLEDMPLEVLQVGGPVRDLSPVRGAPLKAVFIGSTQITDLSPLKGAPLETLHADYLRVIDWSPLDAAPLKDLNFTTAAPADVAPLRRMKTLEKINGKPPAEFWKEYDAKKAEKLAK